MRIGRVLIAASGAVVLGAAAIAPALLAPTTPTPADATRLAVPFELSGLLVTECETGAELPQCAVGYPLAELSPSPQWDGFRRALYYPYLNGVLAPCLREHGFEFSTPSARDVQHIDVSAWYLTVLMDDPDFETALDAWYGCPLLPAYLDDDADRSVGVVE